MNRRPRLLLVGPEPIVDDVIGGTKVIFADFLEYLRESGRFELDVLNTSRNLAGTRGIVRAIRNGARTVALLTGVLARAKRADVVVLFASPGLLVGAGPWIARAARLRGRELCVRSFSGRLAEIVDDLPVAWRELVLRDVLSGPLVFLETRELCERLGELPGARRWPNTRDVPSESAARPGPARKFLFLGQLRPEKGWLRALEAVEAANVPGAEIELTVAGPAMPGADLRAFDAVRRSKWIGPVGRDAIAALLAEHDALLFPSTYPGEGLPGTVIEALQAGLPVVGFDWNSIRELVEHERTGFLVSPGDDAGLRSAVERLATDEVLYRELSLGARAHGDTFRSDLWNARIEAELLGVAGSCGSALASEVPS